jgi:hypothetical protein
MRKLPLGERLVNGLLFVVFMPVYGWAIVTLLFGALWLVGLY